MAGHTSFSAGDHFNKISSSYKLVIGRPTRDIAHYVLNLPSAPSFGSVVLDNACGPGVVTEEIMQLHSQDRNSDERPKIYAVDLAPSMTAALQHKCVTQGWTNIERGTMNAQGLAFPDGIFIHSYMNFGIFFLPDAEKGAAQIHRTLKPGGFAVVTVWAKMGFFQPSTRHRR
jgi:ubiquinone/menaquinone biosynthesis C-methylase UbiE